MKADLKSHIVHFAVAGAALAGLMLTGPAADAAPATPVAASGPHGILPPHNPAASLRPTPDFLASCRSGDDGAACNGQVLAAITHARQALERLAGMSFSLAAYEKLMPAQQLFVTANLERTERGLAPAMVLSRSLDQIAQAGAQANRDPAVRTVPRYLPGGGRLAFAGATWAGGWVSPLGSDYGWMYDDGLGSGNLACSAASPQGCWGHRSVILAGLGRASCAGGPAELAMGAGHTTTAATYGESDTEILAEVCGRPPADAVFTWAKAKKLLHIR